MSPFSISIHVYILFIPYPPSYTLPLYLTFPLLTKPKQDLFFLPVLHLDKKLFKYLYRVFHCDISMHTCLIIWLVYYLYFSPFYLSPLLTVISTV
jgi:hypothetical protein